MLHDLYLMSSTSWVEAASRRNFQHRALSFTEMAAACKPRESTPRSGTRATGTKSLIALLLEGVLRA